MLEGHMDWLKDPVSHKRAGFFLMDESHREDSILRPIKCYDEIINLIKNNSVQYF
jgi:hypothetical protein